MVDTSVLEADVARRESSSLSWGTKLWKCGRVRFIAPVLKTDGSKGSKSSNLFASANHAY